MTALTEYHALSNIDPVTRRGTCSECGEVRLHKQAIYKGVQRFRCAVKSTSLAAARLATPEGAHANRNSRFLRQYGITVEEYDAMLVAQGGSCARCKGTQDTMRLAVDHCHTTGAVRGLLCGPCNTYLGRLEANVERLDSDLGYLGFSEKIKARLVDAPVSDW